MRQGRTIRLLWCVAFGAASAASVARVQSSKSVWNGVYTESQAITGETLFGDYCANCHGDDLEGREEAPSLAGGTFGQRWHGATLKKLFERVEEMPPKEPKSLTAKQYAEILAYLLYANKYPSGQVPLVADRGALSDITITPTRPK